MLYEKSHDKILIKDTSEFVPKHILECGQVFRYLNSNLSYKIFSKKSFCGLIYIGTYATIETTEVDYFTNYFDLDRDYGLIKQELASFPGMQKALDFGHGIRILNQDPQETVLEFIISANNNIPRIQGIIERICTTSGEPLPGGGYAFPTAEELKGKSKDYYISLGAGYRAEYLVKTVDALNNGFSLDLEGMSTADARKHLMKLTGVGRKVADCILLFGYHREDVFPVDVWVERIYDDMFGESLLSAERKADNLSAHFGNLSGYAQQYLFYYYRTNQIKK